MPCSFSILVALAPLLLQAVLGRSSLRSFGTRTVAHTVASKACSCDCCLAEQEDQATGGETGNVKCAPRSGTYASDDSGCSDICMLPRDLRAAFQTEKGDADYSRYCMAQCKPAGAKLHELCIDGALVEEYTPAENPPAKVSPKKAMTQVASAVVSGDSAASESALVLLAKQKMQEAELQAEAAGKAAFTARTAFERLKLTSDQMALQAANVTLREIKEEAAQQAKKALNIRLAYIANAQATATKNALAAAAVYAKADVRDQVTAGVWQERAGQFATAAEQREKMAMDFATEAEEYRKQNEIVLSKQRLVMAHQAIDQASAFGAQSEAAHKQANAIAASKGWYDYAKRAIAAFILAKSMPHDVPPPPMPPIP